MLSPPRSSSATRRPTTASSRRHLAAELPWRRVGTHASPLRWSHTGVAAATCVAPQRSAASSPPAATRTSRIRRGGTTTATRRHEAAPQTRPRPARRPVGGCGRIRIRHRRRPASSTFWRFIPDGNRSTPTPVELVGRPSRPARNPLCDSDGQRSHQPPSGPTRAPNATVDAST